MTPTEERLSDELRRLTATLTPQAGGADDLHRGRRALRRRRGLVAGGAGAAAIASVAVVTTLVAGQQAGGRDRVIVDPAPVASSSAAPSAAATDPRCVEDQLLSLGAGVAGSEETSGSVNAPARGHVSAALLRRYRSILAEHLDPARMHLQQVPDNEQVGLGANPACPDGTAWLSSYGTKLAWRVPGEEGLGMLQVEVSDEPGEDSQIQLAHESWQDRQVDLSGVRSAEVATYDGGLAVIVHRTDGISVALDADTLFGNNSLTPVAGIDLSVEDLLQAAADPRFSLS